MPRYTTILLDLDNTLLDFGKAEVHSFYHNCKEYGIPADEALLTEYQAINSALWRELELGQVEKGDLVVRRFATLFARHGFPQNPVDFNRDYLAGLALQNFLLPGAEEICRALAPHCRLFIASNGVASAQRSRLAGTPLPQYLTGVAVSEEAGAEKPDGRFFTYALALCGNPPKGEVLMVGDSLSADIAGGRAAGLDTCWYNPKGQPTPAGNSPTYTIHRLEELLPLVLN